MALSLVQQAHLNTAVALESVAAALHTSGAPGTLAAATAAVRGAGRLRSGRSAATFTDIRRWVIRELVGPGLAHNPDDTSVEQARAGFAALVDVLDDNNELRRAVDLALRSRHAQSRDSIGERRQSAGGPIMEHLSGTRGQSPATDTQTATGPSPSRAARPLDGLVDVLATLGIDVSTYGRPSDQARSVASALSAAGDLNLDPSTLDVLRQYAEQLSASYGDRNITEALESGISRRERRHRRIPLTPAFGRGTQERAATRPPIGH